MKDRLRKILRMGLLNSLECDEESRRFLGMIQRLADLPSFKSEGAAVDNVYDRLVRILIEETDFEDCSIALWDFRTKHLSLKAAYSVDELLGGGSARSHNQNLTFEADDEIAGNVFRTQSPFFLENGMRDPIVCNSRMLVKYV